MQHRLNMLCTSLLSSKPLKKKSVWPAMEVGAGGTTQFAAISPYAELVVVLAYSTQPLTVGDSTCVPPVATSSPLVA